MSIVSRTETFENKFSICRDDIIPFLSLWGFKKLLSGFNPINMATLTCNWFKECLNKLVYDVFTCEIIGPSRWPVLYILRVL